MEKADFERLKSAMHCPLRKLGAMSMARLAGNIEPGVHGRHKEAIAVLPRKGRCDHKPATECGIGGRRTWLIRIR